VQALMNLFAKTMAAELDELSKEGVRIRVIGDVGLFPLATRQVFINAQAETARNQGMTLVVALNYGGRQEILKAAQSLARQAVAGGLSTAEIEAMTIEQFAAELDTVGIPDPDLLIRTSGEFRISNFMLYQLAYSEIYISPVLWPDFDRYELLRALLDYQGRRRRFGGVS
jgi:undecaprenyl diphosphate synthase